MEKINISIEAIKEMTIGEVRKLTDNLYKIGYESEDYLKEGIEEENQNISNCLECKNAFEQERDTQLSHNCVGLFDLDKLWELHDLNKLDALDFNESKEFREKYRK